ncbi:MAG: hypothetical protein OI74_05420 [Gammaproteobacteria bacterium (ex Lamellibrachia satsuma)]|nr:MAG: hypothetical protein OI74_05420 [Gammaproteobacteria bacterium (ex Lamellibrachia satsuma)]RRS36414.1 MAG: hypothetical protein NV67_07020 [Gammaproteobacteria bacterium (ex Lamellibrachia satsuma)]
MGAKGRIDTGLVCKAYLLIGSIDLKDRSIAMKFWARLRVWAAGVQLVGYFPFLWHGKVFVGMSG